MPHNTVLCLMHVCILGGFKSTILYSRNVELDIFFKSQPWKSQVATEIIVQIKRVKERRKQKSLDEIYNYTFGLNLKRRV